MCCKKKFKFKESCQFYDLYSKNSLDLPLDDNELCVFHSNNKKAHSTRIPVKWASFQTTLVFLNFHPVDRPFQVEC